MRFRFDRFELDEASFELLCDGVRVEIQPKPFQLLQLLLRYAPEALSREQLGTSLWPDVTVGDESLRRAVRGVRSALRGAGADPALVETVRGRGYRFTGEVERVERTGTGPAYAKRDLYIGRADLLRSLESVLDDVRADAARCVCLIGEPGIGKTRTAEEVARSAEQRGFQVAWGRCVEGEGAPALWPWLQVVRTISRRSDTLELRRMLGADGPDLAVVLPELRERLPDLPPATETSPEAARFRLFQAVGSLIERARELRPQVVILDDLHNADPTSLDLLAHVATDPDAKRVLWLGTYRDVAAPPNPALDSAIARLARAPGADPAIRLEGLSADEVAELLSVASRSEAPVTVEDAGEVYARTQGNPYFVRELARDTNSGGSAAIPRTIRAVLRERIAGLSEDSRAVIEVAAVVGRVSELSVLAEAAARDRDVTLVALDEAVAEGLVEPIDAGVAHVRFVHALVQEAIVELLPASTAARLHHRVADAIERIHSTNLEPHLVRLARHLALARTTDTAERAARYATRAADREREQRAFGEAIVHYRSAVDLLEAAGGDRDEDLCNLWIAIAELEAVAGKRDRRREAALRAVRLGRRLGSAELLGRAAHALAIGGPIFGRIDDEITGVLHEALDALPAHDTPLRARLIGDLAGHVAFDGPRRRRELRSEAIAMAQRIGDDRLHFEVGGEEGPMETWLDLAQKRLELARRVDPATHLDALLNHATVRMFRGELGRMDAEMERAAALASQAPGWKGVYWPENAKVLLATDRGHLDEAERRARANFARWQGTYEEMPAMVASQMFTIRLHRGNLRSNRMAGEASAQSVDPLFRAVQMRTHVAEGDRSRVRALFEEFAGNEFEEISGHPIFVDEHWEFAWPSSFCMIADACAFLGDADRARLLYDRLLGSAGYHAVIGDYASAHLGGLDLRLGKLATLLGEFDAAEKHLDAEAHWAEREGAHTWLAHARVAQAQLYAAREDPDRTREVARAAIAIGSRIRMAGVIADSEALLASGGG